ncbi:MAG: hypothetical protein KGZ85_02275 [Ignavibacterium sp.]|nr:hypothetical protein [Ignavibacterium sp.]
MNKIPLFILAGTDKGDSFGEKRINELKFRGRKIIDYLINETKKSNCFSEIYLIASKNLKIVTNQDYFFIEAKRRLWKNFNKIFCFSKNNYNRGESMIGVLLADILPTAADIQESLLRIKSFVDKDIFLSFTPSHKLTKKRGKMFVKKDEKSPAIAYSGTGGLYFLKPAHLNRRLILAILGLRLPRDVRHIEFNEGKIDCKAWQSFRGVIFFTWMLIKIIFYSLIFIDKLFLLIGVFIKLQKKELTIQGAEDFLTKILIKRKYQRRKGHGARIEIIENPVFVDDIDCEEDLKLLN